MCSRGRLTGFFAMVIFIALLFIVVVQFIGLGCGKSTEPDDNIRGSLTNSSECLSFLAAGKDYVVPPCCTGFSYQYDSKSETLSITHYGAGFNCCTDPSAIFIFNDTLILIDENESGDFCFCECLFNIDYKIENIAPGNYTLRFIEIYTADEDIPLELTFDLTSDLTGSVSVERNHYPWAE